MEIVQEAIDFLRGKKKLDAEIKKITLETASEAYLKTQLPYLYHVLKNCNFKSQISTSCISSKTNDNKYYQKLKGIIKSRINNAKGNPDDIWNTFIIPKHSFLFEKVMKDNDSDAIEILNNMFDNDLVSGFILRPSDRVEEQEEYIKFLHAFYMSTLISLAEYLGVIPVENFEQLVYGDYILEDADAILDLIEEKLDLKIKFPTFVDQLFAIQTKRGAFCNRTIYYLYIAIKVKELTQDKQNPHICEIGGGVGYLAYFLDMLGLNNITMVDIPTTSNVSAWFLMKNLPHRNFLFENDENIFENESAIKLITPDKFNSAPTKYFDVVVNCDSFPEINQEFLLKYFEEIKRNSHYFYSINQEAKGKMWYLEANQNIVSELINKVGGFERKSRNLFWLRRGYVEELYKIK